MTKFIIKNILTATLFMFLFFSSVNASGPIVPGSQEMSDKYKQGAYELSDAVQLGLNVSYLVLGIVGSLALLFFVYGGFMFLVSGGSSEKISQAKTIIINATIGLIIIFTSYLIIEFVVDALNTNVSTGLG